MPPLCSSCFLFRDFVRMPPSQVTGQALQSVHSSHSHCTAHSITLQSASCSPCPAQGSPPFFLGIAMSRKRLILPPPHSFEQGVHGVHSFHWQSRGQPCVLQKFDSSTSPVHGLPPFASSGVLVRVRDMVPASQVFEQRENLLQLDHWQSTGHGCSLQVSVFSVAGPPSSLCVSHSKPPHCGVTSTTRDWLLVPPPQEAEQPDQSLQGTHWQSTGQPCALQTPSSSAEPEHA
mmetsp:Transcript_38984/g.90260  ORF Transcript_38984/g.90260 Transcript_38984/m.90260 type:complete len:232 (+) Transcript_38984:1947-2642(+)